MGINLLITGLVVGGLAVGGLYLFAYNAGKNACINSQLRYQQQVEDRKNKVADRAAETIRYTKIEWDKTNAELDTEAANDSDANNRCFSNDSLHRINSVR